MLFSLFSKTTSPPPPSSSSTAAVPSDTATASAATPSAAAAASLSSPVVPPAADSGASEDHSIFSRRSVGQLGFFFAGATFVALSTTITRRAITRRKLEARLKFFQQSGGTVSKGGGTAGASGDGAWAASAAADTDPAPQGSLVALEALNLASLNVVSFFIMLAGGLSWALDLSSIDDLKRLSQRQMRGMLTGQRDVKADEEAERELSEFMERMMGSSYGKGTSQPEDEKPDRKSG